MACAIGGDTDGQRAGSGSGSGSGSRARAASRASRAMASAARRAARAAASAASRSAAAALLRSMAAAICSAVRGFGLGRLAASSAAFSAATSAGSRCHAMYSLASELSFTCCCSRTRSLPPSSSFSRVMETLSRLRSGTRTPSPTGVFCSLRSAMSLLHTALMLYVSLDVSYASFSPFSAAARAVSSVHRAICSSYAFARSAPKKSSGCPANSPTSRSTCSCVSPSSRYMVSTMAQMSSRVGSQ
mmetsp:Transcript_3789/g.15320  ORF Transcript_3789/g.15320 Transcript_3789/m.15320 type:complete len:244 (+) Transcript_3789:601-1332(+)